MPFTAWLPHHPSDSFVFISPFCILKALTHTSPITMTPPSQNLTHFSFNLQRHSEIPVLHPKMPRKRKPIFPKVSNFLRIFAPILKSRKPIIRKLLLTKKFRKKHKVNDLKLLRHYNHSFLLEYQFSPSTSSTPLIHYHQNQTNKTGYIHLCSFYLYWCLGTRKAEGSGIEIEEYQVEALPGVAIEDDDIVEEEMLDSGAESESVDLRAERFIERLYHEMRMHRRESI